jgi:hypothetical protein
MRVPRTLATDNAALMRVFAVYKDFLTLWKDDPDIPILKEAKAKPRGDSVVGKIRPVPWFLSLTVVIAL